MTYPIGRPIGGPLLPHEFIPSTVVPELCVVCNMHRSSIGHRRPK